MKENYWTPNARGGEKLHEITPDQIEEKGNEGIRTETENKNILYSEKLKKLTRNKSERETKGDI